MGPPAPATRLLPPLVLALAGVARGTFTVVAWPRVAVVAFGGSVVVNCSHSPCPGGNATLGLETPLAATPGPGGLHWQSFRLLNVSRWDPEPVTCSGRCGDTAANASTAVLVYRLPERVVLDPVPAVAVGDSRNVTCHVVEVAPLGNLTVTLRRGTETLHTESFGHAEGSASVAVSHLLTVTRGDHGQDVTCHAELSLRPHGPLFARAATPVTLSVFALPEPPELQAPSILEVGATSTASCRIAGAFPAGDTRVTLTLGQDPLNATVEVAGDTVTAVTTLSPATPGPRDLTCTATVATAARTARRSLHVYRFPEPTLELLPEPAVAGAEVTVTCHSGATEPPTVRLQLHDAHGRVLAEGPRSRLELRVETRREDDGREFGCRASLAVGDTVVTKDAAARLVVHYIPEIPASGCPSNRTWVRGAREALSCRATGNPAPTVVCARGGVPVGTEEPELVTRARAGTYECTATNALGTRSRSVTVRVEYEPTLSERGCPERRVWVEGQRRELECRAEGDPPPRTRCARDGDTRDRDTHHGDTRDRDRHTHHGGSRDRDTHHDDTQDRDTRDRDTHHSGSRHGGAHHGGPTRARGSRVVSRADAGRYVCRATNRHGVATRNVVVTVEYEPSIGEPGCPERRLWLEGTPAQLGCTATGNPPPLVTCAKVGDSRDHPPVAPKEGGDTRDPHPVTPKEGGDTRDHHSVTPKEGGDTRDPHPVTPKEGGDTRDHHSVTPKEGGDTRDHPHPVTPKEGGDSRDHHPVTPKEGGDTRDHPPVTPKEGRDSRDHHPVTPNVTWTKLGDTQEPPPVTPNKLRDTRDLSMVTPNVTRTEVGGTQEPPLVTPKGQRDTQEPPLVTPKGQRDTQDPPLVTPKGQRDTQDPLIVTPKGQRDTQDPPLVTPKGQRDTQDPLIVTPKGQRDTQDPPRVPPIVTRAHAGTYECRATNAHGSATRNVTVAVEYGPAAVTLRVLPSANVTRGTTFSLDCGAEGVPAPTYAWAVPPATNLRVAADNRSVTVTGATPANRGLYTCTASNRHGRSAGTVLVSVDESWLVALVALGSLGAVAVLALAVAGGYYLKTTACKKGEYNVRDAEGSSEAACLHRHRHDRPEVFGIQLTQP